MYPVDSEYTQGADAWTWDAHLKAAEACHTAGMPFALGLSDCGDAVDFHGMLFAAFGAELVDAKGNITLHTPRDSAGDGVRPATGEIPAKRRDGI